MTSWSRVLRPTVSMTRCRYLHAGHQISCIDFRIDRVCPRECYGSITISTTGEESVVLLDDDGRHIGQCRESQRAPRATPLHLGFSCYLFDTGGRVLITRRALGKRTWPGVWTNSFCGHPAPGEPIDDAVRRRARRSWASTIDSSTCVLPDFRYRAVAADGTVENEICPVFFARTSQQIRADPDEVMEWMWVSWKQLGRPPHCRGRSVLGRFSRFRCLIGLPDSPDYFFFNASGLCTASRPLLSLRTLYCGSSESARTVRPAASVSVVIFFSTSQSPWCRGSSTGPCHPCSASCPCGWVPRRVDRKPIQARDEGSRGVRRRRGRRATAGSPPAA